MRELFDALQSYSECLYKYYKNSPSKEIRSLFGSFNRTKVYLITLVRRYSYPEIVVSFRNSKAAIVFGYDLENNTRGYSLYCYNPYFIRNVKENELEKYRQNITDIFYSWWGLRTEQIKPKVINKLENLKMNLI